MEARQESDVPPDLRAARADPPSGLARYLLSRAEAKRPAAPERTRARKPSLLDLVWGSPPGMAARAQAERAQPERARRTDQAPSPGVPAAEDPRIFLLERALPPELWAEAGTRGETRPRRTYPILWPGSSRPARVRPEFHGVGVLQAATHAHGRIRTRGLGLMFPPHTVHARDSTSVVVGDNCELTQVDHVHVRQAVVAQDDALRSARVRDIVARAEPGQDNAGVVRDLRVALNDLVERPEEAGPTTMSRRIRADCEPSIHRAATVQLGDDALTRLDSRYVVERTVVPAGALLADSEDLARRYVDLSAGVRDDPGEMAAFLGDLVGAADNATDENVLGYADGLPEQRASVLGLFGLVTVDQATSVMIGVGNRLHTELDLHPAGFKPEEDIRRGVERHRARRPPQPARDRADEAEPGPSRWSG
ncbi:hypothetical protein ACFQFC_38505 [Amorphoplanes digitatis]|uniref:Uncharacterized protein n=1 Tax=Actinoplanes digitatis TaxID=1868 RepID=A0A7W7HWG6_9ACTN|nr:hypothetical protein [Actinoplanes digitatis]MBB4762058.1 hypothetical protein [Actinoplanes digitatis]BFE70803.1 hypothetical protein GCM10020092_041040 [Actinoplanes digitatis]GID97029.1 hypothetical protein Adi01nite_64410 [Actinoplanes digitatis]